MLMRLNENCKVCNLVENINVAEPCLNEGRCDSEVIALDSQVQSSVASLARSSM